MNTRRKVGILLILIGVGIPLVLYFFQEDGVLYTINKHKTIQRRLTADEIRAFQDIAKLKEELAAIEPGFAFPYLDPKKTLEKGDIWYRKTPGGEMLWQDYADIIYKLEGKLVASTKAAYAENHFENEVWTINSTKQIKIPYLQIVGLGVLFIFLGLIFLVFSFAYKQNHA